MFEPIENIKKWWSSAGALAAMPTRSEQFKRVQCWMARQKVQPMLVEQRSLLDLPHYAQLQAPQLELSVSNYRFLPHSLPGPCYRVACVESMDARDGNVGAVVDFQHLPLRNHLLKTVLLHHVLDYSANAHQVLREVSRVVDCDGEVVLFGFNPHSIMGCWLRLQSLWSCDATPKVQLISLGRACDWLTLLGFEVEHTRRGFYRLPVEPGAIMRLLGPLSRFCERWQWPGGGFYLIRAKRVSVMPQAVNRNWTDLLAPLSAARGWDCASRQGSDRAANINKHSQ